MTTMLLIFLGLPAERTMSVLKDGQLVIFTVEKLETILAHDDGHIRNQASEILKSARVWQLPDVHLQTVQFLQGVSAHLDGGE